MHFLRRQGAEAIDDEIARSAVKLPRPHLPASLIFENVHIKAAADTATNLPVLRRAKRVSYVENVVW